MINRRNFLKTTATALPLAAALDALQPALASAADIHVAAAATNLRLMPLPARLAPLDPATQSWQQKIRRVGQSNMTEHDPAVMNIEEWADYWHAAGAQIVFISVTGILAFYPSKVPFHRHGKYLNGRDFFGECVSAAKKRNMHVVARMSPDLNWGDALQAHPEWAMRHQDGSAQFNGEEPRLFKTCMFSSYMDDYVPAIMREVNSLYDIDCFYTNGWPPLGSLPECHCAICSKLPASDTPAYWRAFNDRLVELWQKYDAIAKEKKPDSFFFANLGGNVHAGPNLDHLGKLAQWFQGDNQGRTYEDPAIWGCSLQARVCNAVMDRKFATNITAGYSTGVVHWRNGSKSPEEIRMWMNETLAGGLSLYSHFIGSEAGFDEDRRWQKVSSDYFRWAASHDAHLTPRRSLANIGVVMGQSTQLLYKGPAAAQSQHYMRETTHGIYETLLSGRFAFDFVHEERLDPEHLAKYRALLLPNIAMLSDRQCQQIRDYVQSGGSLLASFETSLYDENLNRRAEFGLADVLGINKAGDVVGSNGNSYYGRIEREHPVLVGFANTNWLPGAQNRVPIKAVAESAAHGRSRIRKLSAGTRLPLRVAHRRASHRFARSRQEPRRLFPRRHRAHLLAYRPRRPAAPPAQHAALDHLRRSHCPGRWRRIRRDVRMGDLSGIRHPSAELHQPECATWMGALGVSARSATSEDEVARRRESSVGRTPARRNHGALRCPGRRPALHRAARRGLRGCGNHGVRSHRCTRDAPARIPLTVQNVY